MYGGLLTLSSGGSVYLQILQTTSGSNFTFQDTKFIGSSGRSADLGVAIMMSVTGNFSGTAILVKNCSFTNHISKYGTVTIDAESVDSLQLQIENSIFLNNEASLFGAGVYAIVSAILSNSKFVFLQNHFEGNAADSGGAIAFDGGTLSQPAHWIMSSVSIMSSNFVANSATRSGGAVFMNLEFQESLQLLINQSAIFRANTAVNGGAVSVAARASSNYFMTVYNSSFLSNKASVSGGAVQIGGLDATVNLVMSGCDYSDNQGPSAILDIPSPASGSHVTLTGSFAQAKEVQAQILVSGINVSGLTCSSATLCAAGSRTSCSDVYGLSYDCAACDAGQYQLKECAGQAACQPCPEGATCDTSVRVEAMEDYWTCPTITSSCQLEVFRCPEGFCLGNNTCTEGRVQGKRTCVYSCRACCCVSLKQLLKKAIVLNSNVANLQLVVPFNWFAPLTFIFSPSFNRKHKRSVWSVRGRICSSRL